MNLLEMQITNREKLKDAWSHGVNLQTEIFKASDTLTEETWKNSGEEMIERVRAALQSSGVIVQGLKSEGDLLAILVKFEANQDSIAVYDNMKLLAALSTITNNQPPA